ncbi:hypothetical protein L596_005932 [Steinernema carpocapsae]|uniref:Uncharacterized protein n=1 Tax=Steinernema carpocapsae TaxID=34508 RepID=A0A4U8V0U6_STECR|nr:hypothetical protein L596_005932 [Steinernema carpocapsae]
MIRTITDVSGSSLFVFFGRCNNEERKPMACMQATVLKKVQPCVVGKSLEREEREVAAAAAEGKTIYTFASA